MELDQSNVDLQSSSIIVTIADSGYTWYISYGRKKKMVNRTDIRNNSFSSVTLSLVMLMVRHSLLKLAGTFSCCCGGP